MGAGSGVGDCPRNPTHMARRPALIWPHNARAAHAWHAAQLLRRVLYGPQGEQSHHPAGRRICAGGWLTRTLQCSSPRDCLQTPDAKSHAQCSQLMPACPYPCRTCLCAASRVAAAQWATITHWGCRSVAMMRSCARRTSRTCTAPRAALHSASPWWAGSPRGGHQAPQGPEAAPPQAGVGAATRWRNRAVTRRRHPLQLPHHDALLLQVDPATGEIVGVHVS